MNSPHADLATSGNPELLRLRPLGLFCSARCPGTLILQAYDAAQALRDAGISVVSGFHSPIEKDCLDLLLRGSQPVVICLARSPAGFRVPSAWRQGIDNGRVLLVSNFPDNVRRITAASAQTRNELAAHLASAIFVIHAGPNSHTLALCERQLAAGKPVFALASPHNEQLRTMGATLISPAEIPSLGQGWAKPG